MPRRMYNATIELAERFDQLTERDLDHCLDQLAGFHPAIGRGEQGTAITISLIADDPDEAGAVVRTLIAQRANPNQVDIVNSTVTTTDEFDRRTASSQCRRHPSTDLRSRSSTIRTAPRSTMASGRVEGCSRQVTASRVGTRLSGVRGCGNTPKCRKLCRLECATTCRCGGHALRTITLGGYRAWV